MPLKHEYKLKSNHLNQLQGNRIYFIWNYYPFFAMQVTAAQPQVSDIPVENAG